jgi:hypothetical protein
MLARAPLFQSPDIQTWPKARGCHRRTGSCNVPLAASCGKRFFTSTRSTRTRTFAPARMARNPRPPGASSDQSVGNEISPRSAINTASCELSCAACRSRASSTAGCAQAPCPSVPSGRHGDRPREKKRRLAIIRTRAPRPSREERLSATKNRVRCPNRLLVNVRLTTEQKISRKDRSADRRTIPEMRTARVRRERYLGLRPAPTEGIRWRVRSSKAGMPPRTRTRFTRALTVSQSGRHLGMRSDEGRDGSRVASYQIVLVYESEARPRICATWGWHRCGRGSLS